MDFKRLTDKARQFARSNPDKVERALDRAGDFVDRRTGRKYGRHVDTVQQKARHFLGGERSTGGTGTGEGRVARPGDRPGEPGTADGPGQAPGGQSPGGTPGGTPGTDGMPGGPDQRPRP
ncbi:antitoxin [Kocuria sp. M1R5S2]|uniref:antitoxin n=1 Tax=Kocuria rhizosphaerae TaxID=3376285 RepID=UPI0037B1C467